MLLAGGRAERYGGLPKGLARVDGARIADRALAALAGATSRQLVVANHPLATAWFPDRPVVADVVPGLGPLGGLETALAAGDGSAVLVVAWDMPFVTAALLQLLRHHGERAGASCVPVHGQGGTAEPLCAYYRADARQVAQSLLGAGERRAHALFTALAARGQAVALPADELARLGRPDHLFRSVDSPADLAHVGGEPPDGAASH